MINCINCKYNFQFDKSLQCEKANQYIRECERFEKVKRTKEEEK